MIAEKGNGLTVTGTPNETGLVVHHRDGAIVAAVKHPRQAPERMDGVGQVEFGGQQQEDFVETALEVPRPKEEVQTTAQLVITALKAFGDLPTTARHFNGLGGGGSEPEAWAIDPETGNLANISAGELQMGLVEETIEAIADAQLFIETRAKQIEERHQTYPDVVIADTSTLMSGDPREVRVNNGHEKGPYVMAVQQRLMEDFFTFSDPHAEQVMDQVAERYGYENHKQLKEAMGNMGYWTMAASHLSVGLPHMRFSNAAHATSETEAIAVGDIFDTNMVTAAEMLMFSSPIIYGVVPQVAWDEGGQTYEPRDVRAVARYVMDTANPGAFVMTPETMRQRISTAIEQGITHTMDRASYLVEMPDGRLVPSAHGPVRNRIASPEPKNQSGRIEYTGCSASFSLLDEVARNTFLQVMTIAAYEAMANGQHPVEYFGEQYPGMSDWSRRKDISKKASLMGFHEPEVEATIQESIRFMQDMRAKYPALTVETAVAQSRLENLLLPPAENLEEYLGNPRGSVAEVMQREVKSGVDPVELTKKVQAYELEMARRVREGQFRLPTREEVMAHEAAGRPMYELFVQTV